MPAQAGEIDRRGDPSPVPAQTPLHALHVRLGARMVEFAGTTLPLHYPTGLIAEHLACRSGAALFDVSHMGQITIDGDQAPEFLETLTPADLATLAPGRQRYALLTNEAGGIEDDAMAARLTASRYHLVVNAARKAHDLTLIAASAPPSLRVTLLEDRALLALQGPKAAALLPEAADLPFQAAAERPLFGIPALVTRSGYTGEDGFEISLPAEAAGAFAERLIAAGATPAGLGARDSLRLEAGLCLYGADITATTTPVEAGLAWSIARRRRTEANFPGAQIILDHLQNGPPRRRVGLRPEGRAPARAGTEIHIGGALAGTVTSGGFSPTLGAPIAMGYLAAPTAEAGAPCTLAIRGQSHPAHLASLPFVAHRYHR